MRWHWPSSAPARAPSLNFSSAGFRSTILLERWTLWCEGWRLESCCSRGRLSCFFKCFCRAGRASFTAQAKISHSFVALALALSFIFPGVTGAAEPASLPAVGALVRVEVPPLGTGWHVGMFNRLRVEPPCYRVAIFAGDGSNRVTRMLGMRELERMQVHRVYKGGDQIAPAQALAGGPVSDDWAEVSMDMLGASVAHCPS